MHKTVPKSTQRKNILKGIQDIPYAMPNTNHQNKGMKLNNYHGDNNKLAPISPKLQQNLITPGNEALDNSVTISQASVISNLTKSPQ